MTEWRKVTFLEVVQLNPRVSLTKGELYPFVEMSNAPIGSRYPENVWVSLSRISRSRWLSSSLAWCSLHSVVNAADLWDKIRQLKAIGAEGILVLGVDKIIP